MTASPSPFASPTATTHTSLGVVGIYLNLPNSGLKATDISMYLPSVIPGMPPDSILMVDKKSPTAFNVWLCSTPFTSADDTVLLILDEFSVTGSLAGAGIQAHRSIEACPIHVVTTDGSPSAAP